MPKPQGLDLAGAVVSALATSERITQYLLENLADAVWRAEPPEGRTIAAIVAHMHNVRLMWLKVAAKGSRIPAQLDKAKVTPAQARKALAADMNSPRKSSVSRKGVVRKMRGRRIAGRP